MKKLIIDLDDSRIQKYDILMYDGKIYTTISKSGFLRDVNEKIKKLENDLKNANEKIADLEKQLRIDHGEEESIEEVIEDGMVE